MTEYVVLASDGGERWFEIHRGPARSAQSAVRAFLESDRADGFDDSKPDHTFVAVPARSFKPVTVKVETKTALRFS